MRAAASSVERSFDGPATPSLSRMASPPEESIGVSVAASYSADYSDRLQLELRSGFSGSYRDFGRPGNAVPPAYLAGDGVPVGGLPSAAGESSRSDLLLIPVVRYTHPLGTVKLGGTFRTSSHSMGHTSAPNGDFVFSDASALLAGNGFATMTFAPETSFSTRELGGFLQYDGAPAPGVRLSGGVRYDVERFSADEIEQNGAWLAVTGLDNTTAPGSFPQLGLRGLLEWDPIVGGGTRIFVTGALQHGDLDTRAIYQLLAEDTGASAIHYAGTGIDWPSGTIPAGPPDQPSITLFGQDTRPPRSITYGAGVAQQIAGGLSLHLRGSQRRTDFLLRRRNLNLALVPQATDIYGRDVVGTLAKSGAIVTTTEDDIRRFSGLGEAWALDPDGWSEYRGVTAAVELTTTRFDLFAAYTASETTDNWVGASSGAREAGMPPGLPSEDGDWSEGVSDFDVPHRIAGGLTTRYGPAVLSGTYAFRSGLPFTPRYRYGVDANGDGSLRNDVAYVPGDAQLAVLLDDWPCLEEQAESFAARNSCRGPSRHSVDARLRIDLGRWAGAEASLVIDALDLVESTDGVLDDALLLVDPSATLVTSPDGATVMIPVGINEGFGSVIYPSSRGRMFRFGLRIGG